MLLSVLVGGPRAGSLGTEAEFQHIRGPDQHTVCPDEVVTSPQGIVAIAWAKRKAERSSVEENRPYLLA